MPIELPAPELVDEIMEVNPLAGMYPRFSLGSLRRIYSTPGLPPVRIFVQMKAEGPWSIQVDTLMPDSQWQVFRSGAIPAQEGYGEAAADHHAALTIRLIDEARKATQ